MDYPHVPKCAEDEVPRFGRGRSATGESDGPIGLLEEPVSFADHGQRTSRTASKL
jgi:hypothetical protein